MIQRENSIEASWKEFNSKSLAQQMSQHLQFVGLCRIRSLESHALKRKNHILWLCVGLESHAMEKENQF